MCLFLSTAIGVASLYCVLRCISWINTKCQSNSSDRVCETNRFKRAFSFIFGLLVVQGNWIYKFHQWDSNWCTNQFDIAGSFASRAISNNRQLAICFLAGVWCLASFVLVTSYSSVLIAYITAPDKFKPIINSVNDLPNKPDIQVTVNRNLFPDVLFQVLKWFL